MGSELISLTYSLSLSTPIFFLSISLPPFSLGFKLQSSIEGSLSLSRCVPAVSAWVTGICGSEFSSSDSKIQYTFFYYLVNMATASLPSSCILRSAPPQARSTSAFLRSPSSLGSVESISKTFGLKAKSGFKPSAIAVYKVKLIGLDGTENKFDALDDCYILDSIESAGIELPYSCRAGACSTCDGKMVSGSVDQSD